MQAGIAGQNLPCAAGGRVAVEDDRDVFAKSVKHEIIIFPYPTESLNYLRLKALIAIASSAWVPQRGTRQAKAVNGA